MMPVSTSSVSLRGLLRRLHAPPARTERPTHPMRLRRGRRSSLRAITAMLAALALAAAVLTPAASAQARTIGTVVVANGWSSADSAVASALAALESGPRSDAVVLYSSKSNLTTRTANFIEDHQPSEVILIGGTAALTAAVQAQVVALVPTSTRVRRIEGTDRFDTAAKAVPSNASTYIVANGYSAADTGVAAAVAATRSDAAVLLANVNSLTAPTERIIRDQPPLAVEFVGGTAVLSATVLERVRELAPSIPTIPRHAGPSRTDTAAAAAPNRSTTVVIANGWSPADMGVAAAYAAITSNAAVLYSQTRSLTTATERRIQQLLPTTIVLVGGSAALDTSLHARLHTLAPAAAIKRISGTDRIDTAVRAADGTLSDIATDPPAAPTAVTTAPRNASLAVSWTAPKVTTGGSTSVDTSVTGYAVQYRACTATPRTCTASPTWGSWTAYPHAGTGTAATITGLTNDTKYEVRVGARNSAGLSAYSTAGSGIPVAQTSTPSGVTVEPGHNLIKVSWAPPSLSTGTTLVGYRVQYRACGSTTTGCASSWLAASHEGTGTTATITGLTNGIAYQVRVQAVTSKGDTGWSPTKSATPELLPYFPGSPTLDAVAGKITVRWNEPLPVQLTISGYEVGWRACTAQDKTCPDGSNDPEPTWGAWKTRRPSGTALSTDITGLINGTKYEVRVRARVGNDVGPWSEAASDTPVSVPSAPPRLTVDPGNTQLTASWDVPSANGSTISGYEIQHCDTTASGGCSVSANWTPDPPTSVTAATTTTTSIASLTNGTKYQVRVRATSNEGDGPWSRQSGTPKAVPAAPTLDSLTAGDRKLTVSWSAPSDLHGTTITGYVVEYRPCTAIPKSCSSNAKWGSWKTSTSSGAATLTKQITGLTNGTKYQVRVRANSNGGYGLRSAVMDKTPFGLPAKPTIRAVEPRDEGLAVTWTKPSENGTPITNYTVQHCTSDCTTDTNWGPDSTAEPSNSVIAIGDNDLEFTITSLTNDTTYSVRVRANIAGGNGPWSSTASGTPAGVPDAAVLAVDGLTPGNRQLGVSWTAPAANGSPITGYDLGYRACTATDRTCPDGQDDPKPTWGSWKTQSTSGSTTTDDIESLTSGTKYEVRVRARNANGSGPWSQTRTAIPITGPATPADVTLDVGNLKLTVSWKEPSAGSPGTTSYEVQYQACTAARTDCKSNPSWGSWGTDDVSITGTTATISQLANGTAYQVQVRAKRGEVYSAWSKEKLAIPAAVPEAPAPTLVAQPKQINVEWQAPQNNGSTVTDYEVAHRGCTAWPRTCASNATWGNWTTRTIGGTEYTLVGLSNGTAYQVRVRARNANGVGPWSTPASAKPVGTPAMPSPPRVTPGDSTKLVIQWIAPWHNGSTINGYGVEYRACIVVDPATKDMNCAKDPIWGTSWTDAGHSGEDTTITIDSLTNGTAYQVRIKAKSSDQGDGPWSSVVAGIPIGTPGMPPDVEVASGNRQLIVSWGTPKWNGATVTGFKVRHCDTSDCDADTDWTTRTVSSASSRSYTISSGLTNDTSYKVEVLTSSSNKGDSTASTAITRKPGGPSRPSTPTLTPGNATISVRWTAPSKNHSDITSYDVEYRECTATQEICKTKPTWGDWLTTNVAHTGTETTATISSLTNGTRYQVRVRAGNTQGKGVWSSSASTTPAL